MSNDFYQKLMQKFFQNLQSKLWDSAVDFFNEALLFSDQTWKSAQPWRNNVSDFFGVVSEFLGNVSDYMTVVSSLLRNKLGKLIALADMEYDSTVSFTENLSQKSKLTTWITILLLLFLAFFWILMFRHAKRNELIRKKMWLSIIVLLGPLGALIYFFGRKRVLEKQSEKHDKVMMSFFSPMHKRDSNEKKND